MHRRNVAARIASRPTAHRPLRSSQWTARAGGPEPRRAHRHSPRSQTMCSCRTARGALVARDGRSTGYASHGLTHQARVRSVPRPCQRRLPAGPLGAAGSRAGHARHLVEGANWMGGRARRADDGRVTGEDRTTRDHQRTRTPSMCSFGPSAASRAASRSSWSANLAVGRPPPRGSHAGEQPR